MILLEAEAIKMIVILLLFIFAYPIYGSVMAMLFQSKVRIRRGGGTYSPDDLPNAVNAAARTTKSIYNKIRNSIGDKQLTNIESTTDKLEQLKQLAELMEKQVITLDEFQSLKAGILGIEDSQQAAIEAMRARAGGMVNRKFGQRTTPKTDNGNNEK